MKKLTLIILFMLALLLSGCEDRREELKALVADKLDPWVQFETLPEAEAAAGLELGMKGKIGAFTLSSFRAIEGRLLEVVYKNGSIEVTVRKAEGEDRDLSFYFGDYLLKESFQRDGGKLKYKYLSGDGVIITASYEGYSYCLTAYSGFPGNSCKNFLDEVFD